MRIGTAEIGPAISATRTELGTVYRTESEINRAAAAALEPEECPDCGHRVTAHLSSGCAVTDRDGEPLPCLCKLSPDDIPYLDNDQEGNDQ
jgi:hypothetical protein